MLHWYQQIIELKKQDPALHEGAEIMLNTSDEHVLSWLRKSDNGEAVVVACNLTDQPQTVSFDLSGQGIHGDEREDDDENPRRCGPGVPRIDSARGLRCVHRTSTVGIRGNRGSEELARHWARRATGSAGIPIRSNIRAADGTPR